MYVWLSKFMSDTDKTKLVKIIEPILAPLASTSTKLGRTWYTSSSQKCFRAKTSYLERFPCHPNHSKDLSDVLVAALFGPRMPREISAFSISLATAPPKATRTCPIIFLPRTCRRPARHHVIKGCCTDMLS